MPLTWIWLMTVCFDCVLMQRDRLWRHPDRGGEGKAPKHHIWSSGQHCPRWAGRARKGDISSAHSPQGALTPSSLFIEKEADFHNDCMFWMSRGLGSGMRCRICMSRTSFPRWSPSPKHTFRSVFSLSHFDEPETKVSHEMFISYNAFVILSLEHSAKMGYLLCLAKAPHMHGERTWAEEHTWLNFCI